jgi:cell division protein FtsL
MGTLSREWAISMAFSLVLLLVFGLGLVWLNIERVDLAYELNKMQRQIDEVESLAAKLEVERNTLITPSRLREVARDYGLGPARPGQIRRVGPDGAVEASPLVAASDDSRQKGQAKPSPDAPPAAKTKPRDKSRAKAVETP